MLNERLATQVYRHPNDPRIEFKYGSSHCATRFHAHQDFSLAFVIAGTTTADLGQQHVQLAQGHFMAIPPGVPHLCNPDRASAFQFGVLYLDPTLYTTTTVKIGLMDVTQFNNLAQHWLQTPTNSSSFNLIQVVAQLIKTASIQSFRTETRIPLSGCNEIDFDQGLSRYQRFRVSKKTYGLSQHRLKQIQRVEISKRLLQQGCSITATAAECGFFDQSHYTKTFRLYTGLTPSQYQSAHFYKP